MTLDCHLQNSTQFSTTYSNCWPLPAQSFSGPSPLVLGTMFYCLRFEISLFVASYDCITENIQKHLMYNRGCWHKLNRQGHGGGIRPPSTRGGHSNKSKSSQSHIATDGQSVSKSWYRAPSGAHDQIFISV
jgi:hypothetical protein